MTDYAKVAKTLGRIKIDEGEVNDVITAVHLCEAAAKASEGIDSDEELAHCKHEADFYWRIDEGYKPELWELLKQEREAARAQAVLAAHAAYKELTDALAEFFYCGDPDDLKRVERAYDKTRDL